MIRKQVYIEPRQDEMLKELSSRLGVSEATLIREGIDRCLRSGSQAKPDLAVWEQELEYLRSRQSSVPPAPRDWTREELYDR